MPQSLNQQPFRERRHLKKRGERETACFQKRLSSLHLPSVLSIPLTRVNARRSSCRNGRRRRRVGRIGRFAQPPNIPSSLSLSPSLKRRRTDRNTKCPSSPGDATHQLPPQPKQQHPSAAKRVRSPLRELQTPESRIATLRFRHRGPDFGCGFGPTFSAEGKEEGRSNKREKQETENRRIGRKSRRGSAERGRPLKTQEKPGVRGTE